MSTSEVIHCPNCNEDVPKTLYCLNCGYPLYKLEKEKTETPEVEPQPEIKEEPAPEPAVDVEPEIEVDMSVEYEPPTEIFVEEPDILEPELEVEIEVEETPEAIWEPPQEEQISEEEPEPEYIPEPDIEAAPEPVYEAPSDPEPIYESSVEPEPEVEPVVITQEEREKYMMNDVTMDFAPDPLTKEIMENLAKNITLKIRLTKLLRESAVKEETFKKLFDSYVDQGRLWVSRRDEIIRRFKSDMERMEHELISARKDFELLDIRKNIGDASDEEYSVKAPAYKWDIEHLDTEIKNCSGGIQYMVNLQSLVPSEEVAELENLAQTSYSELDTIEGVTSDTIARMKETLAEALNTLQG